VAIAISAAPDGSLSPTAEAAAPALSTGRLLFRFGIGLIQLGAAGLSAILREPDGAVDGLTPQPGSSMLRHALVGAAVAAPEAARALGGRAGLRGAQARARGYAGGLAVRGVGILRRVPGSRRLVARLDRWSARAAGTVARLAVDGYREETAARALAQGALDRLFQAGVAQLAGSAEVKRVIHEQSEGIAGEAILDIRAQSRRADNAVEALALRLLGRRRGRHAK